MVNAVDESVPEENTHVRVVGHPEGEGVAGLRESEVQEGDHEHPAGDSCVHDDMTFP